MEKLMEGALWAMIHGCEMMGAAVVGISAATAFARYLYGLFRKDSYDVKFRLATGLALSLEFKLAGEILKTVLVRELRELLILGAVILLRALLSLLIHFEINRTNHA